MKASILLALAIGAAQPAFAQYSARRLTRRIAPQTQQPRPAPAQPAPAQPVPQAPVQTAPPVQYPAYPYAAAAPQYTARPADPSKAAAEKLKNDEKQFVYFKRRAEEGSDHAQYEVGIRYLAGRGVAPDEKLGREWLAKAAKNDNTPAKMKLAELGLEADKIDTKDIDSKSPVPASTATHAAAKAEEPAHPKPDAK